MPASRRDHLVETALALFSRDGFHATGIDRILAEAGVAKMTLYKHFRSKEELVVAALRLRDERFRAWIAERAAARGKSARKQLLGVFDALEEWFGAPGFRGCTFANACAEYGALDHPVHAAAAAHKDAMRGWIRDLAAEAGAADANEAADQVMLLMDGATMSAHVTGNARAARRARRTAKVLLKQAGA